MTGHIGWMDIVHRMEELIAYDVVELISNNDDYTVRSATESEADLALDFLKDQLDYGRIEALAATKLAEAGVKTADRTGWYSGEDFVAADDGELLDHLRDEAVEGWFKALAIWTEGQGFSLSQSLIHALAGERITVIDDLEKSLKESMAYCHDEPQFRFDGMGFEWHEEGDYLRE